MKTSLRRVDGVQSPDLSTQKTTGRWWPLGDLTSIGSFTSSTYVQPILFGNFSLPTFQTELAINSHIMLSDIHRNVLTGQGGVDSQHHLVSARFCPPTTEYLPSSRLKPGQFSRTPRSPQSYICTAFLPENHLPRRRGPVSDATN